MGVKAIRPLLIEGPAALWDKVTKFFVLRKKYADPKIKKNNAVPSQETSDQRNVSVHSPANGLILVYQMGRVGSRSIVASLDHYYPSDHVVHGHYLSSFEKLEKRVKADLADTTNFMSDLKMVDERVRKAMREMPQNQRLKIISLVRDPVARNVSTFFFALSEFVPGWEAMISNDMLTPDDLHAIFVSKRTYVLSAFNWFDEQIKPVFGIDVYSTPFPKEKGYKIHSASNVDLLLLRLENLDQCAKIAFREFLDIEDFELTKVNVGEERTAGDLYRLFKTKPLPQEYVQWTYQTKLARHFYTEAELDAFTKRWTMS